MKTKYIKLLWVLIASITLSFVSCSSDDEPVIETEESPELSLEVADVKVAVRKTASINIKEGNGEYKVFSLNNDIAEVVLADNKITINAISKGKTALVVSDKSSQYKQILIETFFDALVVDRPAVDLKKRFGGTGTIKVTVLEGNDNYVAESDNKEMATASVQGNVIAITGLAVGKVNITLKDRLGMEIVLPVTITETMAPYNVDELATIMKNTQLRYNFMGETMTSTSYKRFNRIENGMNAMGWEYYDQFLRIYFPGDKEVGVKEGSKISYTRWAPQYDNAPCYFEIIKNDGVNIWAIYSVVKNGKMDMGNFTQKIKL